MLVSRIKPCKSQSKWINSGSADGSLNQQQSTRERRLSAPSWITMVTPLLIHVRKIQLRMYQWGNLSGLRWMQLTETRINASNSSGVWMIQVNRAIAHNLRIGATPQEFLPYQLLTVV